MHHPPVPLKISLLLFFGTDDGILRNEFDIFKFTIQGLNRHEQELVDHDTAYEGVLRDLPKDDPYCLDELFNVFHRTRAVAS